jgi:hypothetical protein
MTPTAPREKARPVLFVPGLFLAMIALFMVQYSLRETATLVTRGGFVRDQFEIAHVTDNHTHTPQSFGGKVVSTGEEFLGLDAVIVGADVLTDRQRAGTLQGHRVPIYRPVDRGAIDRDRRAAR